MTLFISSTQAAASSKMKPLDTKDSAPPVPGPYSRPMPLPEPSSALSLRQHAMRNSMEIRAIQDINQALPPAAPRDPFSVLSGFWTFNHNSKLVAPQMQPAMEDIEARLATAIQLGDHSLNLRSCSLAAVESLHPLMMHCVLQRCAESGAPIHQILLPPGYSGRQWWPSNIAVTTN